MCTAQAGKTMEQDIPAGTAETSVYDLNYNRLRRDPVRVGRRRRRPVLGVL
jgi:hypothetical protein